MRVLDNIGPRVGLDGHFADVAHEATPSASDIRFARIVIAILKHLTIRQHLRGHVKAAAAHFHPPSCTNLPVKSPGRDFETADWASFSHNRQAVPSLNTHLFLAGYFIIDA